MHTLARLGTCTAAITVVIAPATTFEIIKAAADGGTDDDRRKARYRESDEVKTYYRVNRYPTK